VSPAAFFCGTCGASLGQAHEPGDGRLARAFGAWGELKYATVLFADIVSSTELVSALEPEEAMERLQPALLAMCDAVERFDGTIVRTMGDGILALFGAPHAHEGHALLACEAALAIRDAFPAAGGTMTVRIGLHSGDVVSDPPAADFTRERGAHGLTIHLASRVPLIAEPGTICITEDCYRLVRTHCEVQPLGQHRLKGIADPVEVYRLTGLNPAVASEPFRGKHLTTLLGRDHEIAMLQRTLRRIDEGENRVTGIVGLPGAGKSRLCYEFARWCRGRLIPVFEARAQLYGHATPLLPVLEFLRALFFRISATDEPALARQRIAERMAEIGPTFQADIPLLYEFLGVPQGEGPPSTLTPKARRARLLDIIRHMVRHGGATTSVIIVEDLHWLDEASEEFIATLVDAVAGTRTMLVVNYRPSYVAPWMKLPDFRQIMLTELGTAETEALVKQLIGTNPELDEISGRVARRCSGNPFFAEELVRSLAENGALVGEVGNYSRGPNAAEGVLPATVQAVIGARIDRLGESEKKILQICAVVGKEIPLPVLERVADAPLREIEAALGRLAHAELLQPQSSRDGREYAFRHPLIQEVAYASQLKSRRGPLHASVAAAMENCYGDRPGEFAGLIAYHYEAAGDVLNAAQHSARAAAWVGSTSSAQAIKHWEKVRALLRDQPRSGEIDKLRIMASAQISWLGWREGLTAEEAKPFIEESLRWAREIDDTMIPLLLIVDGRITVASGGPADAYVDRVNEALSLLDRSRSPGRYYTLKASLCHAYGWAGLLNEALDANDEALKGLSSIEKFDDQFLGYSVEHWTMSLRGRLLARLNRLVEAGRCFETMLALDQALVDPTVQFIAHLGYIDIAWCRDDAPLAREHASRVAEIAERHGSPYLQVFAFACSGVARRIARDFDGAIRDFGAGLDFLRQTKAAMENETEIMASLADCFHASGEHGRAIAMARETISVARQRGARLPECRASITCAAALAAGDLAAGGREAEVLFARAEDLIRVTGAKIYEPLLLQERTRFAVRAG
jgi:adenylate cyclase